MKIKIDEKLEKEKVVLNCACGLERIENIKAEIKSCFCSPEPCKVEVFEMWEERSS